MVVITVVGGGVIGCGGWWLFVGGGVVGCCGWLVGWLVGW